MNYTATITPNWQIHIPLAVRNVLKLETAGKVSITVKDDSIVIKPISSGLLSMAGKYRHLNKAKNIDLDNVRDIIDYSAI